MPLSTTNKRRSTIEFLRGAAGPAPSGAISQTARWMISGFYALPPSLTNPFSPQFVAFTLPIQRLVAYDRAIARKDNSTRTICRSALTAQERCTHQTVEIHTAKLFKTELEI